ncbi:hypothetical protein zjk6_42 [Pseudomonas phage zjk6]|nr:hypothetical protein zjk6_42 [Pseudomonas phage zjk6]
MTYLLAGRGGAQRAQFLGPRLRLLFTVENVAALHHLLAA